MSKNKHTRTFKLKRYPSEVVNGITHVYPPAGARVSRIVERDRLYFSLNPGVRSYIRPYVPGELDGVSLPDGMTLSEVTHISILRLGDSGQARIPLTEEQARKMMMRAQ
jgi:hypothetical protein